MTSARLNAAELERALVARIHAAGLCRITGLSPATVSRLRRGYPITSQTLRRLVSALEQIPVSALTKSLLSNGVDGASG